MSNFNTATFCGASIRDIKSNLGWNGQKSTLEVALIEDPVNNDAFLAPTPGTPVWLSIPDSAFRFFGLMHSFQVNYDLGGNPTISVRCEDVREILDATIVVISNYSGPTSLVPNLINAFGYWENILGFGGAEYNESGMPWYKILNAIQAMTASGGTLFGGPIRYRDYFYKVDLSELPVPPTYYRVPGTELSLLSLIQQICDDGMADFFVELQNTGSVLTIKVRTVSKRNQPALGTISTFINQLKDNGNCARASRGLESRNDITSSFCIGGYRQYLYEIGEMNVGPPAVVSAPSGFGVGGVSAITALIDLKGVGATLMPTEFPFYIQIDAEIIRVNSVAATDPSFITYNVNRAQLGTVAKAHNINTLAYYVPPFIPNAYTFWGFDVNNQPIVGYQAPGTWNILDHEIVANSAEVADIVGGLTYRCKVIELLTSLVGSDFSMWMSYMRLNRPVDFALMKLSADTINATQQAFLQGVAFKQPNDNKPFTPAAFQAARFALLGEQVSRHNRIFSFIRKLASDYLGRQYLVRLPFLTFKQVSETNQIVFSEEPVDSGYDELELELGPLGLEFLFQQQFQTEDGKYYGYIRMDDILGIDLSRFANQSGFVVQGNSLFIKVQVDPKIIFIDPITPCARITLPSQVFELNLGNNGVDTLLWLQWLHGNEATAAQIAAANKGAGGIQRNTFVQPPPRHPDAIVIPMKSNISTYGPWFALGDDGKTQFINDSSLVPWNYGNIENLNQAGFAKVINALSHMLYTESGSAEFAGLPSHNLGDTIQANGANITDISISYSIDRITTSYRFQSYTQRFGVFSRDADRRLQRLARAETQNRAVLRQGLVNALQLEGAALAGLQTKLEFQALNFAKRAFKGQSPHGFLAAYAFDDHTLLSTVEPDTDYLARVTTVPSGDSELQVGGMSLDGFFRPFTTYLGTANVYMPKLLAAPSYTGGTINVHSLNPFGLNNDIALMIRGEGTGNECDLHNYWLSDVEPSAGTRPLGLRGPLMIVGWGYDLHGNITPSSPMKNFINWKAGPLDLHFDEYRGVWSSRDLIFGYLSGNLLTKSTATMCIADSDFGSGNKTIQVYNPWSASVSANTLITAGFSPYQNKWCIISADCPGV